MSLELSDAFRASAAILIKLADAQKDDPDLRSTENEDLQGEEEALWYNLSTVEVEMDLIRTMSADLWYLADGGPHPESKEPDDALRARFSQARVDDALVEIAVLLHDCPKLAVGVEGVTVRHHLWKSLGVTEMANRFEALGFKERFKDLKALWKRDTIHLSCIASDHPAYQEVIRSGMPMVPILLEEMRDNPDWWGPALEAITGENPCRFPEMSGRLDLISKAWVNWGIARGYPK
jgi:hypothetical protein